MELQARHCAPLLDERLQRELPCPTGFVLWLFHRDGPEFTFISNTTRDDMDRAMAGFLAAYRRGMWSGDVTGTTPDPKALPLQALPAPPIDSTALPVRQRSKCGTA